MSSPKLAPMQGTMARLLLALFLIGSLAMGCDDDAGISQLDGPAGDGGSLSKCGPGTTKCAEVCVNTSANNAHCGACDNVCKAGEVCTAGKCLVVCGKEQTTCNGACVNTDSDPGNCGACDNKCKDGQVCSAGKCVTTCASGTTNCSGACVNTDYDASNCGACGNACKVSELCVMGKCLLNCPDGFAACAGKCVNTQQDHANCGACGAACKVGEVCAKGKCTIKCPTGHTECKGACVNTQQDQANCGACGAACKVGEICKAGKCEFSCPTGLTDCNKQCVGLETDPGHCGGCNNKCKATEVCVKGKCLLNCPVGQSECAGVCVNTATDVANCGACGNKCQAGFVCAAGKCTLVCPPGQVECSGICANLSTDPNNCGACANKCGVGQVCANGACMITCLKGQVECSGSCSNLQNDPANCGACGNKCKAGQTCQAGKCVGITCDVFTYGLSARPVDIVFVIDQSGSMASEIKGVKTNLNKFSTFIAGTKIDYHVVMLAARTGSRNICIAPPLGGASCADGPRYKQVNVRVASTNSLSLFKTNIAAIESFLRKDSLRQIVEITDDRSATTATSFDSWITARPGWKDYVFHSIVATKTGGCTDGLGTHYITLSKKTGGIIQHICSVNWQTVWTALGKAATGKAITQYKPTKGPILTTLEVFYNNVLKTQGTDWSWDTTNKLIQIKGTLPALGTKIMACYMVQTTP